jgi:hypothetical protein
MIDPYKEGSTHKFRFAFLGGVLSDEKISWMRVAVYES